MRVIIVGAGICGLSTAIALNRVGIDVVVLEKLPQVTNEGAAITIWNNGLQALTRLGLETDYRRIFEPIDAINLLTSRGLRLGTLPIARLANQFGPGAAEVYRPDLAAFLAQHIRPQQLHFNAEVTSIDANESEVVAIMQDGRRIHGDVLIAADGIGSKSRQELVADELVYCKHIAWRGVADFDHPFFSARQSISVLGRGGYFVAHHLTNGRFYWIGTRAMSNPVRIERAAWKSEAQRWFADWAEPVRALIAATPESGVLLNAIFSRVPTYALERRIMLLGDAAHASAPQLGQGAGLALEDAVLLAYHLKQHGWPNGAARFIALRDARVRKVLAKSQALADFYHRNSTAGVLLRNLRLRVATKGTLLRKAGWSAHINLPALQADMSATSVQYA